MISTMWWDTLSYIENVSSKTYLKIKQANVFFRYKTKITYLWVVKIKSWIKAVIVVAISILQLQNFDAWEKHNKQSENAISGHSKKTS